MSNRVEIELTKEVANDLLDREYNSIDFEHLPFSKFTIKFPTSVYLSKDKMIEDIFSKHGITKIDPIAHSKAIKEIDKYSTSNLSVKVNIDSKGLRVSVIDSLNALIFKFNSSSLFPLPVIEVNEFSKTPSITAMEMYKMIGNVIQHINSPTVIVKKQEIKEEKAVSKKKQKNKGKNTKKTYIYKTKYILDNLDDFRPSKTNRKYERRTESWKVKGFWRHYKSGKSVWIKEQTRGEGKQNMKQYRITKI